MLLSDKEMSGFTLMELLAALLITSFLAIGVAQYLAAATQVRLIMHQDTLAARTAEDLARQLAISQSPPGHLNASRCTSKPSSSSLDTLQLCRAYQKLPQLRVRSQGQQLTLSWQGPTGTREVQRPLF
ncbi:prepilin-type N-terminal cleavage/methylation domain-containing protein [Marinospirillum celere]|uniref:Prepilin-type N-terminal cleavage/methylation domain-containing protein n=1 Tax=Marinospirillum celere TaxID=1122252 RepID=A0A1I1HWA9_9GAMM|nr:prepilin-type N-terminal cleavage/methylation domain-containing protein [Marinospirillum celere]SFC27862.1 prepilin-type N-terminal cleavage/methylation domain-containing protein [Marinospirillum celere]